MSLTKTPTKNNQNFLTQLVAARLEKEDGTIEVSGKKVGKSFFSFLIQIGLITTFHLNILENIVFYVNQAYLSVQKKKKIIIVIIKSFPSLLRHRIHQITLTLETYVLKDREIKLIRPR